MSSEPTQTIGDLCSTLNCGKQLHAGGFCVACYYRLLRQGKLTTGNQTKKWKHRLRDIDVKNKTASCLECGLVKITRRGTKGWRCSVDTNLRSKLYKRAYRQSKKDMLQQHCEICGRSENLCWDHSHETDVFRGTLCKDCNLALGLFKDNVKFLKNAIKYLKNENTCC